MLADIVERLHIRAPHRPAATEFLMKHLGNRARMVIELPNLGDAGPGVSLAPPLFAFARENEQLAVGRQIAVAAVIVEQKLLRLALLAIDDEEAFAVLPKMIARRLDQQIAVG